MNINDMRIYYEYFCCFINHLTGFCDKVVLKNFCFVSTLLMYFGKYVEETRVIVNSPARHSNSGLAGFSHLLITKEHNYFVRYTACNLNYSISTLC